VAPAAVARRRGWDRRLSGRSRWPAH